MALEFSDAAILKQGGCMTQRQRFPREEEILEIIHGLDPEQFRYLIEDFVVKVRLKSMSIKGLLIKQDGNKRKWIILISVKDTKKEKLVTFVHEVIHLALGVAGAPFSFYGYDEIARKFFEEEIDKAAYKFLKENPRLVMDLFRYPKYLI